MDKGELSRHPELGSFGNLTRALISAVDISHDGKLAVTASADKTARTWELPSGRPLGSFCGHTDAVRDVAVHQDGSWAVSASDDHTVQVWEIDTGQVIACFTADARFTNCALASNGMDILAGDAAGRVHFFRLEQAVKPDGQPGVTVAAPISFLSGDALPKGEGDFIVPPHLRMVVLAENSRLIGGYDNGSIGIWISSEESPTVIESRNPGVVTALAVSGDGRLAASGTIDGELQLWDLAGQTRLDHRELQGEISALAINDDRQVAIGSSTGSLLFWDLESEPVLLEGHGKRITALSFLFNGLIVSGSADLKFRVWNPQSRKLLKSFTGHPEPITAIGSSRNGDLVAWGCRDGHMYYWSARMLGEEEVPKTLSGNPSPVLAAAAGDHPMILSGSEDGIIRVIDLEAKKIPYRRELGVPIIAGALSPDGQQGVIVDQNDCIHRFRIESGP